MDSPGHVLGSHSLEPSTADTDALLGKTGNDSTSPLSVQAMEPGGRLLEVPRLHHPPIRTPPPPPRSFPLLPAFTAPTRRRGGLGALHADDKVKESLRPPGTSYLSRVLPPAPLIFSTQGTGWLIRGVPLHNQQDCVVLFAPPP